MSTLDDVAARVRVCPACPLSQSRKKAVPGEGPADAQIVFIGEAPGFNENEQGRPFVGAAGKFLDELLAGIGMKRKDVFITNIVKCRPPANRDPMPNEIEACRPYLDEQIEIIQPRVIVTLGRYSMERFLPGQKISAIHGKPRKVGNVVVVPMFHPAAALHQPKYRADIEADFKRLPQILRELGNVPEEAKKPEEPPPQQLSLF